jgi:biotin carboxyl carrier protein
MFDSSSDESLHGDSVTEELAGAGWYTRKETPFGHPHTLDKKILKITHVCAALNYSPKIAVVVGRFAIKTTSDPALPLYGNVTKVSRHKSKSKRMVTIGGSKVKLKFCFPVHELNEFICNRETRQWFQITKRNAAHLFCVGVKLPYTAEMVAAENDLLPADPTHVAVASATQVANALAMAADTAAVSEQQVAEAASATTVAAQQQPVHARMRGTLTHMRVHLH